MTDRWFLGADVGGTQLRVGLGTGKGILESRTVEETEHSGGPAGVVRQIVRMSRRAVSEAGLTMQDIERMGVAAPGPLDPLRGIVYEAPNMPEWHEVHLKEDLEALLGVPVVVLNDANSAALGEHTAGAGRPFHHLVYLTVSTGVGGGIVVGDVLLEGAHGMAGELGHMTIDRNGPLCKCGNIGCLEALASGTSIARRFREQREAGRSSVLPPGATAAEIADAAKQGDALAADVFHRAAQDLGFGVVDAIHIFNPEVIVIGGGVSQAGDLLFDAVREIVERHAMAALRKGVTIVPAELGDNAGLYGALEAARQGEVLRPGSAAYSRSSVVSRT